MKIRRLRLFFLLFLFFVSTVMAVVREDYTQFEHISAKQGLSQSVVHTILQGRKGFMWFGTQNGLIRFDGYAFTTFKHKPGDSLSLPANEMMAICEDRSGTLWVGTIGGGLSRFDREYETFTTYLYQEGTTPASSRQVDLIRVIKEGSGGILWLGTWGGGLLRFDPRKDREDPDRWAAFTHDPGNPNSLSHNRVQTICLDHEGILWVGTQLGGLNRFDPRGQTFSNFSHSPDVPDSLSHNNVTAVIEDRQHNLWVGTADGLNRFERQSKRFIHYKHQHPDKNIPGHNRVNSIFQARDETLWFGTRGGLEKLTSITEKTFTSYSNQPGNPYSLSHNSISSITEDRDGSLWLGTSGGGINRIDPQKGHFGHVFNYFNKPGNLSSNDISSFCRDKDGGLWVGTYDNGLNRYDPDTGKFSLYNSGNGLGSNEIMALYRDSREVLWVATWGGGISRFDPGSGAFINYRNRPGTGKGPGSNNITYITEDRENRLWIATRNGGLNRFEREDEGFIHFRHSPSNPESISSDDIIVICPDRQNKSLLWVGTLNNGLNRFNQDDGTSIHYSHNPDDPNSLNTNSVLSIYISPRRPGILWVGNRGGGLNRFDLKKREWTSYTEENGLPDNTILGILEDNRGRLWLSTNRGISRFDPGDESFTNYDSNDGLQADEFNQGAYYKSNDGRFYFGGINGFNNFIPGKITPNPNLSPIVITSFKVANQPINLEKSILETREIHLGYKDYVFSFEFAALNYVATSKNQYSYKMDGLYEDWVPLGHKRDITFTRLPPGPYTFHVRGSNSDGTWNNEGTSIRIIIRPPFWATVWFRMLIFLMLAGIIFTFYKLRVRKYKIQRRKLEEEVAVRTSKIRHQKEIIEDKNQQLEISNLGLKRSEENLLELNATKDKFFSIISHDLRNHLTTLLGTSDLLSNAFQQLTDEKRQKHSKAINKTANQLYDLLENLLQWAKSQTGVLKCAPKKVELSAIILETLTLFNSYSQKKKIEMTANIPGKAYAYTDRNMFTTVLRNLVSNAIKFTGKGGKVQVTVEDKDNMMVISVIDSGIGINSKKADTLFKVGMNHSTKGTDNEKGTGLGLILCKEFIEKNNGNIWYEPRPADPGSGKKPTGSIFRFTLPQPENRRSISAPPPPSDTSPPPQARNTTGSAIRT
ncbi:MAG: hypothetical protein GY940_34145 [bacterium]|nr:hypothetical protein [bacterium]